MADNKTGYYGVHHHAKGHLKSFQAQVRRGGNDVYLGCFATAEKVALCVTPDRPKGQAAARRAAVPLLARKEAAAGGT